MSLDADMNLLSKVSMFDGFSHDHLRLLAFGAEGKKVPKDTVLYKQGGYSDGGYVVVSGSVSLMSDSDGSAATVHGPAALLGELTLISGVDHAATAVVSEDAEVLKIPRSLFRRMLEEYPELAVLLQQRIAKSVDGFVSQLETVAGKLDRANELLPKDRSGESAT